MLLLFSYPNSLSAYFLFPYDVIHIITFLPTALRTLPQSQRLPHLPRFGNPGPFFPLGLKIHAQKKFKLSISYSYVSIPSLFAVCIIQQPFETFCFHHSYIERGNHLEFCEKVWSGVADVDLNFIWT